MPRNSAGVYSKPAGTTAAPSTTIESAKFNSVVDDIVTDLNNVRPISVAGTGAEIFKATQALLYADLAHDADKSALVYADATKINNGIYLKVGASGAGSWSQITEYLPGWQDATAQATSVGGTANAITATVTGYPDPDLAKRLFIVPALTNTSGTVTLTLNGGSSVSVKSASGADLAIGALQAGIATELFKNGSEWRQIVSSAPGATMDFQGAWDSGTTYTQSQFVVRNNVIYFLDAASSLNEDPESGSPWVEVFDFSSFLLLTPSGSSNGMEITLTGSGNGIEFSLDMTNTTGAAIYMYGSNPPVGAGNYDYLLFQHRNDADTADITSVRAESDGAWNFGWHPFIEIGGSNVFPRINIHGDGNGAQALSTLAIGDPANSQLCGRFSMYKSRGGDPSTRGIVSNGDPLGYTQYIADNGVNLQNIAARFGAEIQGTPSATALPTAFRISLTPAGTIGLQTALYLTNAGQLQLPGTAAVDGTSYERLFISNAGGQSAGTAAVIRSQPTSSTNRGVVFGGMNEGSNDLSFTVRHGSTGGSEPTIDKFKVRLSGAIEILDGITAPTSTSSGMAAIYIDTSDGDLKIRFSDGTVKTIVVDT